ncbi:MAG: phosphate/phosphite/phosphonate ABC transporter substrate-binding protein [Planctomycetes bacterium]|nr:phosphate/phosphite/phosphonate ABC transporter substrate-binding protein [Planctomycetota bacterium]
MKLFHTVSLAAIGLLFAACGADSAAEPTAKELRFSVIPDFNKAKLADDATKLAAVLSRKLGVPVRYEPSNDYTMAVNGLIANKLDFVWLGGKTTVDAIDAGKGSVHVLATRDIDLAFKSYFIGNKAAVDGGKLKQLADLAELQPSAKALTFTFGDKNSTSGHLMPRHFLVAAGIDPERDFKTMGYAEGGHSGTLKAVASGSADLGALNFAYYDKASAEDRANAPILYTTPDYVDYAWVAHDRLGAALKGKLRDAFLQLDPAQADDKAILTAWSAGRFVPAEDELWNSIREVRDSLPKGFLK